MSCRLASISKSRTSVCPQLPINLDTDPRTFDPSIRSRQTDPAARCCPGFPHQFLPTRSRLFTVRPMPYLPHYPSITHSCSRLIRITLREGDGLHYIAFQEDFYHPDVRICLPPLPRPFMLRSTGFDGPRSPHIVSSRPALPHRRWYCVQHRRPVRADSGHLGHWYWDWFGR